MEENNQESEQQLPKEKPLLTGADRRAAKVAAHKVRIAEQKAAKLEKKRLRIINKGNETALALEAELKEIERIKFSIAENPDAGNAGRCRAQLERMAASALERAAEAEKTAKLYREFHTNVYKKIKIPIYAHPYNNTANSSTNFRPTAESVTQIEDSEKFVFEKNLFPEVVSVIIYSNHTLNTYFTDHQALNLCGKMADASARRLVNDFHKNPAGAERHKINYQLHYLANKALKFYGGPIITFLYGLRPLKFNSHTASKLRLLPQSKRLAKVPVDFPTLTFSSEGTDKYTLVFHLQEEVKASNPNKVRVYSKTLSKQLGSIDEAGYFVRSLNDAKPYISLFCSFINERGKFEFSSGVETGSCFVCGRELTHPDSVRYGIGPVCLQNMGGVV